MDCRFPKGLHFSFGCRTPKASDKDHVSAAEESAGSFLAKAIQSIEEKTVDTDNIQNNMMPETGDYIESGNFNVTVTQFQKIMACQNFHEKCV